MIPNAFPPPPKPGAPGGPAAGPGQQPTAMGGPTQALTGMTPQQPGMGLATPPMLPTDGAGASSMPAMPPAPGAGGQPTPAPLFGQQPSYAPQQVNAGNALPQFTQFADAAYSDATRRLDPQFAQAEARFRQDMVNRGLAEGTEAYDKAFANFSQARNDAYSSARNQAMLAGLGAQNQAFQQQFGLAQEGNRLGMFGDQMGFQGQRADMQDLMALLGYGTSVNQQNNAYLNQDFNRAGGLFGLVPGMSPVQVDVMSPYSMQQQAWANQAGAANQNANGLWGAVGQLGSAFLMSDRRLKTDIEQVGELPNGLPVYLARYVWGGPRMLMLMAQDVLKAKPHAVREFGGYLAVNYQEAIR